MWICVSCRTTIQACGYIKNTDRVSLGSMEYEGHCSMLLLPCARARAMFVYLGLSQARLVWHQTVTRLLLLPSVCNINGPNIEK